LDTVSTQRSCTGDLWTNPLAQMINSQFAIYNKSSAVVQAARPSDDGSDPPVQDLPAVDDPPG
jgi:hypothetical protein